MGTILIEALSFIGVSVAGGVTWDLIKGAGSRLLADFKSRFVKSKYFKDEKQAEEFLKEISSRESFNKRQPLEDIWVVYDNYTGIEASDLFKTELINWFEQNQETIKHLGENPAPPHGLFIRKQINKGHAQVTNIGNQYNDRGTAKNGEETDK